MPDKLTDKVNTKVINDSKENKNFTCMTEQKLYTMPPADIVDLINHLQKVDEKNKDDIRFLQLAIDQKRRKIIRLEEDNQELEAEVESLEAENKDLIKDNQSLKFAKQSLENERLKVEIDFYKHSPMITIFEQWKKEIEAEAYKECIEKVRNLAVGMHPCSDEMRIFDSDLDNLLKELVGGSEV